MDLFKPLLTIGLLIWLTMGVPFIMKIYQLWRDKTHYIKKIYIFSDGFVWETYKKDKPIEQKIFRYEGQSCDMSLKATNIFIFRIYVRTDYLLCIDYYDDDNDKWRKFRLHQSERNLDESPDQTKWLVMSIKLIYNSWLNYRD